MSDRPEHQDDDAYEALARTAGQALRRPASDGGLAWVRTARRRRQQARVAVGGVALAAVVAVGASIVSRDDPPSLSTRPDVTEPVSTPMPTAVPSTAPSETSPTAAPTTATTAPPSTTVFTAPVAIPLSDDAIAWRDAQVANGFSLVTILDGEGTTARLLVSQSPQTARAESAVLLDDGRVVELPEGSNPDVFKLYAVGGRPALVDLGPTGDGSPLSVWQLDPATADWTSSGDLGLGDLDGSIASTVMPFGVLAVGDELLVTVEEYADTGDGTLVPSPARRGVVVHPDLSFTPMMPSPDGVPMAFSIAAAGRALALFGPNLGSLSTPSFRQPWAYDPATDTWSEIPLPDWFECSAERFDCDWWLSFDGGPTFQLATDRGVIANIPDGTVGLYDPLSSSWTRVDAPFAISGFWSVSIVGDHVVVGNGRDGEGRFGTVGVLDLRTATWTTTRIELTAELQAQVEQAGDPRWDLRTAGSRVMAAPSSIGGDGPIEPIAVYDTTTGRWEVPTAGDLTNWVLLATDIGA